MNNIESGTFAVEGKTVNKENNKLRSAARRRVRQPRPSTEIAVEKEMGKRLQTVRVKRDISVPQLSSDLKERHPGISGLGATSLYGAESGERCHTPLRLGLISQYFNFPVSYFIFGPSLRDEVAAIHNLFREHRLSKAFLEIPSGSTVYTVVASLNCDAGIRDGYYRVNDGAHYLHIKATPLSPLFRVTIDDHVEMIEFDRLQSLLYSFTRLERITHYIKAV